MESIDLTDTQLYETFREILGKNKAEKTVSSIKNIARSEVEGQTKVLATSEQLAAVELRTSEQLTAVELRTGEQLAAMGLRTSEQLAAMGLRTSEQFSVLELRLNKRIHKAQIQTIIWIVSVGLLQLVTSYLLRG